MDTDVIIVGAGFAGLGMAIQLKKAHTAFIVLERADDVGGTWRDNTYPGCACDIPSTLYSYSFEPNPAWTRVYPRQGELLEYLRRCALKYHVRANIRFNTGLREARYDEATATWQVTTSGGETLVSRVLISAMGPLSKPNTPTFAGRERFAGAAFHSAQWDSSVDLRGKRVAVIGTGASAIQIVPEIAPDVAQLTLFQRTPPWIVPRADVLIDERRRRLRRWLPGYGWAIRKFLYWFLEIRAYGFTVNPKILQAQEKLALRSMRKRVRDPALQAKLTPAYRMGCKRVLISDDYYPALNRPNVTLVTDRIAEFREHGIATDAGTEYPLDVAIFGTGFRATDGLQPVRIYGRGGVELSAAWQSGMEAYLGTSVAGFPNFFTIIGPNTGLGHNSMVLMMEAQYRYILDALRFMRRKRLRAFDVRSAVQRAFNERLQARMKRTVWASGCASWYIDARGKNTTIWPGFTFAYRWLTRRFRPEHYELVDERGRAS
ncbi:MAG: NAD(P)/FAD-dependent oxidoreductase [Candidatus Velthaea sp.]